MKKAIVVLGHGSRREEANREIRAIVEMLGERNQDLVVRAAYAEFAQPTLEDAVAQLAAEGMDEVVIVPLFLTVGNHLQQKLPLKIAALANQHQDLIITTKKHIGADPLVVQIIENRIR